MDRLDEGARDTATMLLEDLSHSPERARLGRGITANLSAESRALSNVRAFRALGRIAAVAGVGFDLWTGWQDIQDADSRREVLQAVGGTGGSIAGGILGGTAGASGVAGACLLITGGTCAIPVVIAAGVVAVLGSAGGKYVGQAAGGFIEDSLIGPVRDGLESLARPGRWMRP